MKFILPVEVLLQHLIALGKTGSGKSSVLRLVCEYLLKTKQRVCVIDPKGEWHGVKLSADGKSMAYPVICFGDFKEPKAADIPINQHSGKQIAELVVSGNRPCVIGFRGWYPSAQARFWIDFASTIFNSNQSGGLSIIIDEIQNFAPKERAGFGDENLALHWTKRLLSEGRGLGLSIFCGSQRPQSVHNAVLSQCETLVAMKLLHDADCTAVENWMKRTRDKEKRAEIMSTLPDLQRGEAWVWSPEAGFGPVRMKFPMFETFDSFAPPQTQKKVALSDWTGIDLDSVKEKLAKVIEEQQANDPAELKRTIADLKRKLTQAENKVPETKQEVVKEPVFDAACRQLLETVETACKEAAKETASRAEQFDQLNRWLDRAWERVSKPLATPTRIVTNRITRPSGELSDLRRIDRTRTGVMETNGSLGKCEQAILQVLAQFDGIGIGKLALLAGYTQSGSFKNSLSSLRSAGLIEGENTSIMRITPAGEKHGPFPKLPTGEELVDYWLSFPHFGACERAIISVLRSGGALAIDELCKEAGYEVPASGSFKNSLSTLRTAGVIVGRNTDLMGLNPEMFQ